MAILKLEVHINNFFYKKFFRTDPENPEKNGVPPKKNEILLHPNSGFNFNCGSLTCIQNTNPNRSTNSSTNLLMLMIWLHIVNNVS